mgnify:CR=1 FL=1
MSYVGNIIAAVGAIELGKYNRKLYNEQARVNREKALVGNKIKQSDLEKLKAIQRQHIFDKIERPRLVKQQELQYAETFVGLLKSGVEIREDTTPFFVLQDQKVNQATDLAIADYNLTVDQIDMENQSLLLQAKGQQAYTQGLLVAASEGAKAASSYQQSKQS